MGKNYELDYLKRIEALIPSYCFGSFMQDEKHLGESTTKFLIFAATEYYLTGNIINLLKKLGGNRNLQDTTQLILDDFIQLITNQNLIILVCNRIEILTKFDNTDYAVDRATINQLNKLYNRINAKCPLKLYPMNPIKKLKIYSGLKILEKSVNKVDLNQINIQNINLDVIVFNLNKIRL